MIKRVFVISLCIALIFAALVVSASAATLDYNDYITDIEVNGDLDLITVSFPTDAFHFNLYTVSNGELLDSSSGSSCLFDLPAGVSLQLGFGPDFDISLDNIPSDTQFTVVFDTSVRHGYIDETNISYQGWFLYTSSNDRQNWVEVNGFRSAGELSVQGNLDGSYSSFTPFFYFYDFSASPLDGFSSVEFGLSVNSLQATFSISSLYRLQQESGKTNTILKEVEKQLADQGKTLDDILGTQQDTNNKLDQIINGDNGFDSSGSDFGSQSDELSGAGDQMGSAMGDGMASLGTMVDSAAFATTLTTLSALINVVFEGHEIEICGIQGNLFMILVTVFSVAILLPLGLKFIFRKWGENSSGGGG